MIEDAKASCLESPNNLKHEKYTFKRLTSTMFNGKSYYSIIYEKDGEEHEGYSSFSLDVISDFLKEYFLQPKQPDSGSATCGNPENMNVGTTDDLISREDALMSLTGEWKESRDEILSMAIRRIKRLPSAQPESQWIPCKKKLPDENGFYLVTDDSGGIKETHESFFVKRDDGSVYWSFTNVIAWNKMPDPYGGEQ